MKHTNLLDWKERAFKPGLLEKIFVYANYSMHLKVMLM